jgi:hypothetical protein
MKTWVKLYTGILDDPEVGAWALADVGLWALLLALAGKIDDRVDDDVETGRLADLATIAWHLRRPEADLEGPIARFVELGMLRYEGDLLYVTNYGKRQARPPSARRGAVRGRVKRWRSEQASSGGAPCNVVTSSLPARGVESVTPPDTDTEKKEADADPAAPAPGDCHLAWQQARGLAVNALDAEQLDALIDEFTPVWVLEGIREANASRSDRLPSLKFLQAILDRWRVQGFKAPFDPKKRRAEFQAAELGRSRRDAVRQWEEVHS